MVRLALCSYLAIRALSDIESKYYMTQAIMAILLVNKMRTKTTTHTLLIYIVTIMKMILVNRIQTYTARIPLHTL